MIVTRLIGATALLAAVATVLHRRQSQKKSKPPYHVVGQ